MRYILSLIVFVLLINTGQSQILLLMDIDSATTLPSGGSVYATDSLRYAWVHTSLSAGSISTWGSSTGSLNLVIPDADTSYRPIKTAGGLIFDGNDALQATTPAGVGDTEISLEFVIQLTDSGIQQKIGGVRLDSANVINIRTRAGYLCAYANNGTIYRMDVDPYPAFAQVVYIVVTWSGGAAKPQIYINGILKSEVGESYLGEGMNTDIITLSDRDANMLSVGSNVLYFAVREYELDATEVLNNYNSSTIQDLIP